MNYSELERGLDAALKTGLQTGIKAPPTRNVAPSALAEAGETLNEANRIVSRILELADRLCGPVPTAGETRDPNATGPSGELGRLRASMRDTRQAMVYADEALNRIEQELIG